MLLSDRRQSHLPWYAVQVRTNAEQRLRNALSQKGYQVFLPTYLECRQYSDRVKKIDAPLFPGYLFCRLDADRRLPILTTPGVHSIVGQGGIPQPVEESEISDIQRALNSGASAIPWPYLRAGDSVEIKMGAFTGLHGVLVNVRGIDRLVLSIHLLQRSIAVEIDRTWVRPRVFAPAIPLDGRTFDDRAVSFQ